MFKVGNLDLFSIPEENYHQSSGQKRGKNEKAQGKKGFAVDSAGFGSAVGKSIPDPGCRKTGAD
jgi:hypothetical protein